MHYTIQFPQALPVTCHTDYVTAGSTFVAMSGAKHKGVDFIPLALEKGATKIVVENNTVLDDDIKKLIKHRSAELIYVDDAFKSLGPLAAQALGNPAEKLKIVGITGTKGKTSSAYMTYHMLLKTGYKVALISTVEKRINGDQVNLQLTTPLADQLHMFFALCVDHGVDYVIMEVSAQALTLARVEGVHFDVGIFTNFSHEHLEFYSDMDAYFHAKTLFIPFVKKISNFFINIDDEHVAQLKNRYPEISTFSLEDRAATVYGVFDEKMEKNLSVQIGVEQIKSEKYNFYLPLLGKFNAYNLLGVVSILHGLKLPLASFENALKTLPYVPGRMEQYHLKNGARCFIDYAHNPSSFEAVLSTLRLMTKHLIVVFGAAGNRDKHKRPMMGAIAQKYCDIVILTSDNPRDESPILIARDVQEGFDSSISTQIYQELNRVKAIEMGYELTKENSILAILGKGRDEYQIVGGLTFPFKERSIIRPFVIEEE